MTSDDSRKGKPANHPAPGHQPGVFPFAPRDASRNASTDGSAPAAGTPASRAALAAELRRAAHLPARLRQALALACDGERPICTVSRLAAMAGCDRRTLWNQWRGAVGREAPVRLEDFLHWQLLLRAMTIKEPGMAWADVAERLGVHPHTVARQARQLAGRTLREMNECSACTLAAEFEASFLPHLFPAGREDAVRPAYDAPARRAS